MKVLIIEDDARARTYLSRGLTEEGCVVETAADGIDGLHRAQTGNYDVIVLDGMLPGRDGLDVLQQLRTTPGAGQRTPVIMLTARDGIEDRVRGLRMGADDYLVKPFSFIELVARLQALMRRGAPADAGTLAVADLRVDAVGRKAWRGNDRIQLTPKEFQLLLTLMRRPGQVLSKTALAELVWDAHFDSDLNVVEAAVKRLRAKVDEGRAVKLIHTLRGMGYVLEENTACVASGTQRNGPLT